MVVFCFLFWDNFVIFCFSFVLIFIVCVRECIFFWIFGVSWRLLLRWYGSRIFLDIFKYLSNLNFWKIKLILVMWKWCCEDLLSWVIIVLWMWIELDVGDKIFVIRCNRDVLLYLLGFMIVIWFCFLICKWGICSLNLEFGYWK